MAFLGCSRSRYAAEACLVLDLLSFTNICSQLAPCKPYRMDTKRSQNNRNISPI